MTGLNRDALSLVKSCKVLTLGTEDGSSPWTAPVYYLFYKGAFYFLSKPESRHIRDSLGRVCAGSVFADSGSWKEIRGVQVSGKITVVSEPVAYLKVIKKYVRHFDLLDSFFRGDVPGSIKALEGGFRVKLYKFTPDLVIYNDNSRGFGFREKVKLEEG